MGKDVHPEALLEPLNSELKFFSQKISADNTLNGKKSVQLKKSIFCFCSGAARSLSDDSASYVQFAVVHFSAFMFYTLSPFRAPSKPDLF